MTKGKEISQRLSFSYKDSKGNISTRLLTYWKETSVYIQGRAETGDFFRTFRKDRVLEYFEGSNHLRFDLAPPPPLFTQKLPTDVRGQILFTGFSSLDRTALEKLATDQGLRVVKSATKNLAFLCAGYNAGWAKMKTAAENGAFILNEKQLVKMFENGDVSESDN